MLQWKDLTDIGDSDYAERHDEMIECQNCGMLSGGTRGDSWHLSMKGKLHCVDCESDNLALVRRIVTHVIVKE